MITIDDVPEIRKRKMSAGLRTSVKASHKHQYKECLLVCGRRPCVSSYCTICGKIGERSFFKVEEQNGGPRVLKPNEVFGKYKHLGRKTVSCFRQDYVSIP